MVFEKKKYVLELQNNLKKEEMLLRAKTWQSLPVLVVCFQKSFFKHFMEALGVLKYLASSCFGHFCL